MRLGIVGSREFLDYSLLAETVDNFVEKTKIKVEKIVSGGAKGADTLAARYASEHSYPLEEFKPDRAKALGTPSEKPRRRIKLSGFTTSESLRGLRHP